MPIDDLPLDRPPAHRHAATPPEPPHSSRWIVIVVAAMLAGSGLTFWWMSRTQPVPPTPAPVTTKDAPLGNRPKRQPLELPALNQSDSWLRALISALSNHPTLARLLATPGLIRGAVLAVVQIGDGRTPSAPLAALRPSQRLQLATPGSGPVDPKSYARWDTAAAALTSVSPAEAAQLYVNIKPLIDEAYIELGSPDGDFDEAIVRAIRMLAETPVPAAEPVLTQRSGYAEHEDRALAALRPVQKQFLLLGPDNRRRVLAWLRQFASNLDLKVD